MKYNYQIIIEYLGASYIGWQIQKKGKSIQGEIQKAIYKTFHTKVKLIGAVRTDTGVNALAQSANFYLKNKIQNKNKILATMNFFLRKNNISIIDIKRKKNSFHSRFDAKKRSYEYIIINRGAKLSVLKDRAWLVKKKLNIKNMKDAISLLIGKHDFSTFRSSSCSAKSPIRTILKANIKNTGSKIIINFISRSFLQQQVRSMVGSIKYVGENKWDLSTFKKVFKSKKRNFCAPPAPPEGLYLKKVYY